MLCIRLGWCPWHTACGVSVLVVWVLLVDGLMMLCVGVLSLAVVCVALLLYMTLVCVCVCPGGGGGDGLTVILLVLMVGVGAGGIGVIRGVCYRCDVVG